MSDGAGIRAQEVWLAGPVSCPFAWAALQRGLTDSVASQPPAARSPPCLHAVQVNERLPPSVFFSAKWGCDNLPGRVVMGNK